MLRLAVLGTALSVAVIAVWLAGLAGAWLFSHVAPLMLSHWFAPGCSVFTGLCTSFGAIFLARKRRKGAMDDDPLTPLPPASQRPL